MFYRDHCVCHTMMFAYCLSQRGFSALLMDATSQTSFFFSSPTFLSPGSLTLGLVRQCQTIHGRDRTCTPPRLPGEWITVLLFIILGIISLTVTCGLVVMSHWHREASRYARWIAFTGSTYLLPKLIFFSFTCERGSGMCLQACGYSQRGLYKDFFSFCK